MTVDTASGGGEIQPYDDPSFTGLEDFDTSRMMVPRIGISHREGKFTSPFDKSDKWDSPLDVVVLAVAKQRLLWHVKLGEPGDLPLCKSSDGVSGFPTPNENLKDGKVFPWDKSGFDPSDQVIAPNGMYELPCANCQLKNWDTHPLGGKPYCNELYTFVTLVPMPGADPEDVSSFFPALFSVQRTSLKAAESYMTTFKATREPMFKCHTEIRLEITSKGGNEYSLVRFRRLGPTSSDNWPEYRQLAYQILTAIKQPPAGIESDDTPVVVERTAGSRVGTSTETKHAESPPPPSPTRPKPSPARPTPTPPPATSTAVEDDDDDLPF